MRGPRGHAHRFILGRLAAEVPRTAEDTAGCQCALTGRTRHCSAPSAHVSFCASVNSWTRCRSCFLISSCAHGSASASAPCDQVCRHALPSVAPGHISHRSADATRNPRMEHTERAGWGGPLCHAHLSVLDERGLGRRLGRGRHRSGCVEKDHPAHITTLPSYTSPLCLCHN
jgi:hypothetical protein